MGPSRSQKDVDKFVQIGVPTTKLHIDVNENPGYISF